MAPAQRQKRIYLKQNPTAKAFQLHNLRGTAMTKAKEAGISDEDAAVAFGSIPRRCGSTTSPCTRR